MQGLQTAMVYQVIRISRWDAIASILYNYFEDEFGEDDEDGEAALIVSILSEENLACVANELEWHISMPRGVRIIVEEDPENIARFETYSEAGMYCCLLCGEEMPFQQYSRTKMLKHVRDHHDDFLEYYEGEYEAADLLIPVQFMTEQDWRFTEESDMYLNREGLTKQFKPLSPNKEEEEEEVHYTVICPLARTR